VLRVIERRQQLPAFRREPWDIGVRDETSHEPTPDLQGPATEVPGARGGGLPQAESGLAESPRRLRRTSVVAIALHVRQLLRASCDNSFERSIFPREPFFCRED